MDTGKTKIELSFTCQNLVNLDTMGKVDPQVIVYGNELVFKKKRKGDDEEVQGEEINWIELGKTESLTEQINPKFKKKVMVDYRYNKIQDMKFVVVDYDSSLSESEQEVIGELRCTLSDIVGAQNSTYTTGLVNPLKFNRKNGYLSIHGEEFEERMLCFCCWPLYKKVENKESMETVNK